MIARQSVALLGITLLSTSASAQVRTGMINVGDATLRYELSGRGQTVVFVHGWANTLAIWDDQVRAFTDRYQVLRYDRRGFGRSTGDADVSADPDDLRILLDSLGIASAFVVGLSAGSEVATRFAFTFPRRTIALVRLSGPPPDSMPGAAERRENREMMAQVARLYGMDSLGLLVHSRLSYVPPNETDTERQQRLDGHKRRWADYSGRDLLDPKPESGRVPRVHWRQIPELIVPTLLVNGDHDLPPQMMTADSLARYLPNVKKVVIPRAGHAANLSAPARFNEAVLAFFQAVSGKRVNVGDAVLAYEIVGSGKPIVFIHGWAQDMSIWDDQVGALSPAYRVIRYDKRGFGQSTGNADITADPDDLRILLDSLGIRSAHLVGISRGARIALSFARAFPDRADALVLYGMSPPEKFQPAPQGPSFVAVFADIARKHGMDSVTKAVWASPLAWMPSDSSARAQFVRRFDASWSRYRGRDLLDPHPPSGRVPLVAVDQLSSVKSPTLIINGDHDVPLFLTVADTLARHIPGARKVVLPNAGHGAHFYDPQRFNAALMEFFRSVDRRARTP